MVVFFPVDWNEARVTTRKPKVTLILFTFDIFKVNQRYILNIFGAWLMAHPNSPGLLGNVMLRSHEMYIISIVYRFVQSHTPPLTLPSHIAPLQSLLKVDIVDS